MMTIQSFVNEILQIPVTRIGNKYTVEAIEIVIDTYDHKFYPRLCEVTGKTSSQLENALRDAKEKSFSFMSEDLKEKIFPVLNNKTSVSNTEFIVLAAQYYKENYENKEEG